MPCFCLQNKGSRGASKKKDKAVTQAASSEAPDLFGPPTYTEKKLLTREQVDVYEKKLRQVNQNEWSRYNERLLTLTKSKSASWKA